MLPKIKLELDSVQLFEAQAKTGARVKEFEEVKHLNEHQYDMFIGLLREYSQMLQMEIMRNYAVKEKQEQPAAAPKPKQKEPEYYGAVVPKEVAKQRFDAEYEKCFGRKPKKIA